MNPNNIIPLEDIRIAKPCRADWNLMTGDERARFCGSCAKNVYDISQMTREAAHQLIAEKEGNVCVRLYRRPDGTVITSDCPVGKREVMKPMWWTVAGFVALMASGAAVWSQPANTNPHASSEATPLVDKARQWPVIGAVVNVVSPAPRMMMGAIAPAAMGKIAPPTMGSPAPIPTATPATIEPEMGEVAPPMPEAGEPEMGDIEVICPAEKP